MKNHLNINKFFIVIFSFICFLIIGDKVDAKYVCYYEDPMLRDIVDEIYDKTTKETIADMKQIYIRLTYDNGAANFQIYDFSTKQTRNILMTADGYNEYYISFTRSAKQLTDDDFKNGCPEMINRITAWPPDDEGAGGIVYDAFKPGSEEYIQFYQTKLKNSVFAGEGGGVYQNNDSYCYEKNDNANSRWICEEIHKTTLPETEDEMVESGKITTCSYSDINYYENTGDLAANLNLTLYHKTKIVSAQTTDNSELQYISFSYDDIKGTCPNQLYMDSRDSSIYLHKGEVPEDGNLVLYGLIHSLKFNEQTQGQGKSGCSLIGDNTLKIVKKVYNLVRYLVPIIIIVFSVIDFAGVVISGENDKMEKAKKKFITRLVIGIIILFIPIILEIILKLIGILGSGENLVDVACLK